MKITELVEALIKEKIENGDMYVYYMDGENGAAPVEIIEKEETYSPSGIPFIMLKRK
jgi:hypothetical protein